MPTGSSIGGIQTSLLTPSSPSETSITPQRLDWELINFLVLRDGWLRESITLSGQQIVIGQRGGLGAITYSLEEVRQLEAAERESRSIAKEITSIGQNFFTAESSEPSENIEFTSDSDPDLLDEILGSEDDEY